MRPPDQVRLEQRTSFFSAIGFHAQQAVEKHLKALLTHHAIEFPKTHSITRLLTLLAAIEPSLAASLVDTEILSAYGVESRYPGEHPDLTEKEALEARDLAEMTRQAILTRLGIQHS